MKVKGNDGETACNALSSCWQTTQLSGCTDHDGCWHSRMFHAQMSISIDKMQPGVPHRLNSFPALCYPASCFQRVNAKKQTSFLCHWCIFSGSWTLRSLDPAPQQGFMSPGLCPTLPSQLPPCQCSDHWQFWHSHQISLCQMSCALDCHRS